MCDIHLDSRTYVMLSQFHRVFQVLSCLLLLSIEHSGVTQVLVVAKYKSKIDIKGLKIKHVLGKCIVKGGSPDTGLSYSPH